MSLLSNPVFDRTNFSHQLLDNKQNPTANELCLLVQLFKVRSIYIAVSENLPARPLWDNSQFGL